MNVIDIMNPPEAIWIGRKGENVFREVPIDCSGYIEKHPNATITAMYQSGENEPFPVVLEQDGSVFTWKPRSEEITDEYGRIEIVLTDGAVVGASKIVECFVDESLIDGTEHPAESAPAWSVEMVQDVTEQADRAETAVSHYPQIVNGVWFVWDATASEFVSTGISAQGEDGVSPTVTVTAIEGGHRVTITDADGAHTFDVMDGEGGGSGAVESVNGQTGAVVLDAEDVGALPDDTPIPPTVTEQTVAGWGFTKNTGTYSKPSGGIPASDLEAGVIPTVPQMATAADMSDWTSGKTVDAALLKTDFQSAAQQLSWLYDSVQDLDGGKADQSTLLYLLIPILRQGLYGTNQEAAISALESALGGTPPVQTFFIMNNLTNVANSNEATAVNSGAAYSATLTALSGIEIQTVTVTMGGVDVTSTVYSNGTISIASVTGNIVITAIAESIIETYTPTMSDGYINVTTGATGGTSTYKHTEIIPVREGDKVYGTTYDSTYSVTVQRIRSRFTAAYDANGEIYPSGGVSDQHDYTVETPFVVPSGVYGVVFSIVNSLANQVVVYVDKSERVGA